MSPAIAKATKGEETRSQILAAAVEQASACGFESLTIGTLAEKLGMSKSGLFAHFGSKIELQMAALDEAARQYTEIVYLPAMKAPRGLKRLRALFENWINWPQRAKLPGGCPIDAATREYHHQPGPMRDAIFERQKQLDRELRKTMQMAIDNGELRADADAGQLAYELIGIVLGFFRSQIVLGEDESRRRARVSFERLISDHTP
jgi:AcrR family transcriptional regulator